MSSEETADAPRTYHTLHLRARLLSNAVAEPYCHRPYGLHGSYLQSLPKACRWYLAPEEGRVFIKSDFSAFQLRLLAHLSQDKVLVEMFQAGGDPDDEMRQRLATRGFWMTRSQAKTVIFAIRYGGPAWAFHNALGGHLSTALRELLSLQRFFYPWFRQRSQC
jgi:hypothetical protein